MASMSRCILVGRIVRDPELKTIPSSGATVTSFTIAIDNPAKQGAAKTTSYIPCTCWNKTAENVAKYCSKGSLVAVDGRLNQRNYEDKQKNKRSVVEVIAESVQFLEKKGDSGTDSLPSDDGSDDVVTEGIDTSDSDLPF